MQNGPNGNVELQPKFISAEMAGMIEAAESRAYARGVEDSAQCADRVAAPNGRKDEILGDIGAGMRIAATVIADAIRALTKGT